MEESDYQSTVLEPNNNPNHTSGLLTNKLLTGQEDLHELINPWSRRGQTYFPIAPKHF